MSISNLSSKIRKMASTHSVVIVALLPIPNKNRNIPHKQLDQQRQTNREVLYKVLQQEPKLPSFKQNPGAESGYYNVLCADGNFRHCKLVLAAWLDDCPDYSGLHHLEWHFRFWCECRRSELWGYDPADKQHPRRDHNLYRMLRDANTKANNAELSSSHVYQGFNVIRHITCIVSDLGKPDLLHTMQLGMLDHPQK